MGKFQLNKKGDDPIKIYEDTFKIAQGTVETHLGKFGKQPNPISRESKANEFGGFDPAGLNDEGEWYDNPSWEAGYTMSTDEIRQHNVNTLKDRFNAQKQGGYRFSYDDEIDSVRNISASNGGWSLPQSVMKTPEGFDALRSAKDEVISWIKDQQRAEKSTLPDPSWESKATEWKSVEAIATDRFEADIENDQVIQKLPTDKRSFDVEADNFPQREYPSTRQWEKDLEEIRKDVGDKDWESVEAIASEEFDISKYYKEVMEDGWMDYQCNSCGKKIDPDDGYGDQKDYGVLIQELKDHQINHKFVYESKANEWGVNTNDLWGDNDSEDQAAMADGLADSYSDFSAVCKICGQDEGEHRSYYPRSYGNMDSYPDGEINTSAPQIKDHVFVFDQEKSGY